METSIDAPGLRQCAWAKLAVVAAMVGIIGFPSAGVGAPSRANGQVFRLIGDLDTRVETIEAGLQRSNYFAIGKQAFQPNADVYYVNNSSIGAYASKRQTKLYAPVHLPDGALITGMVCFFYDEDSDNDLTCTLGKMDLMTAADESIAEISTMYDPGRVAEMVHIDEAVNNRDYAYYVEVAPYYEPNLVDGPSSGEGHTWGFEDPETQYGPLTAIQGIRINFYVP